MAPLRSDSIQVPPFRLCSYLLFYFVLLSLFTHIMSALITYGKITLLDIGHRYTNLFQDTLSRNPTWPLEILRNTVINNGHSINPSRRRIKKHSGKRAGIRNRLRKRVHIPPLPSILHTNIQSLENKGAFPLHGTARYGSVRFTFGGFSTGYCTWYLVLF